MMDRPSYKWMDGCGPSCWSVIGYLLWIAATVSGKCLLRILFLIRTTCAGCKWKHTQLCCYLEHKDLWSLSASCFHDVLFCRVTPRRLFCSSPQSLVIRLLLLMQPYWNGLIFFICAIILSPVTMMLLWSDIGTSLHVFQCRSYWWGISRNELFDWNVPPVWLRHLYSFFGFNDFFFLF